VLSQQRTRNNKQQTLLCQGFGRVKQRTTNKEQETKNVKSILFTYIAVLILLAVLPINGTNSILNNNYLLNIRWDYLVHALVYIPLVPLIIIVQIKTGRNVQLHGRATLSFRTLNIIIISLLYAFSLEGIQYFLSYRAFNINDMVANGVGVILGSIFYLILKKERVIFFLFNNKPSEKPSPNLLRNNSRQKYS